MRGEGEGLGEPLSYQAHRDMLEGGPEEVLARLLEGDPLGLAQRTSRCIAGRALLLQPQRLFDRAIACLAREGRLYRGDPPMEEWISARIDRCADGLLLADWQQVRMGIPGRVGWPGDYAQIAERVGTSAALARAMCVAFNTLEFSTRDAFSQVFLQGKGLERYAAGAHVGLDVAKDRLAKALAALSLAHGDGGGAMGAHDS